MRKLILCFFLTLVISQLSLAEVRYVSHSGTNTPPYLTWETAADSIMRAINISSFGDTIYVANGVYEEIIDMINGLSLIGAGADSCIIDTRGIPFFTEFYSVSVADSCTISGFKIFTYDLQHGTGINVTGGASSIIEYCNIQQAIYGIDIYTSPLNQPLVQKNTINNVTYGIGNSFSKATIKDNVINAGGNSTVGIYTGINSLAKILNNTVICSYCYAGYSGTQSVLKNNLFYGSGNYGLFANGDSIINNVIYGKYGGWDDGIFGADLYIENNHIEKSQKGIRYDTGGGSAPVTRYNSLWNNQVNFKNFTPDTTNFIANPMFDDAFNQDFHLQLFSPLIDAGDPSILDVDGSRSDIGIFGGPLGESYTYNDLAPAVPVNFSAVLDTNYIILRWDKNTEADFSHYNLYRDTVQGFVIDSTSLAASVTDTFYLNIISAGISDYFYRLTAVDNQGNESSPSIERHVVITDIEGDEPAIFNDYHLYQNYPNPFNPTTKIGYRLKERGYVKLYVYDIKGELVETLVNQYQDRGYYEVNFGASGIQYPVSSIRHQATSIWNLASGVYIYQIMVKNEENIPVFSDIKKMILAK